MFKGEGSMSARHTAFAVVGLAVILALIDGYAWVAAAQNEEHKAQSRVAVETQLGDDTLASGRSVHVQDDISGDLAAAGADVTIDGRVNGYVMGAGRTVRLEGPVGNDVWAAGETVTVDNTIGNNAMMAGRRVTLGQNAVVGHDARLAGQTVTAQGRIERDLTIGAETAQIGADVGGAVTARAERVSILPGAVIRGDLIVRANQPPEISPQARVLGQVRYEDVGEGRWLSWSGRWLFSFIALLLLGMAALAFAPAWPERVAGTMRTRAWASVLSGIVLLIVIPVAVFALAVTIIGIPLAIVIFALYIAALLLAGVFVSYRIGDWLLARLHRMQSSIWVRMLLGVLVLSLAMSLPAVGMIVTAIVLIVGAGALTLERRSSRVLHPIA
jgi:hypothetical protein